MLADAVPADFALGATAESCIQHWLKLQLGESLWQVTTTAVTSHMRKQDEEIKIHGRLTLTVDISPCNNVSD